MTRGEGAHRAQIHVVEYDEDTSEVVCVCTYSQPHETWDLCSCPSSSHAGKVLTTVNDAGVSRQALLWDLPILYGEVSHAVASEGDKTAPKELCRIALPSESRGGIRKMAWNPNGDASVVVSLSLCHINQWNVEHSGAQPAPISTCRVPARAEDVPEDEGCTALCWDPHHANTLTVGDGRGDVHNIDLRAMAVASSIPGAHYEPVLHIDYNPNRPYVAMTSSEDGHVHIWDLRKLKSEGAAENCQPLYSLEGDRHSHWVTSAKYNRFHDQLLLTGSTDSTVRLWRVAQVSSSPPTADAYEGAGLSSSPARVRGFANTLTRMSGLVHRRRRRRWQRGRRAGEGFRDA